ncbi:MAG: AbrB/MazE/SpoVT family DNA-binding domain-containing protein [Candidatus Omnitrophica bacterium]|nr:AbrB/MazE/SpoVT family DNA-binding domain-containing protein [Candidatus Omnitrophota bacterium]
MKEPSQVYGTVTIGQRGQVVIPMKVRKALKISAGDQLIVMSGPPGRKDMISFIPAQRISQVLQYPQEPVSGLKKEREKGGRQ